jgi:hypothetical protein
MWAFLMTLAFTLFMTGMIWCMQILEYPLFALVGPQEFPAYHLRHNRGLPFVVIAPSLLALASAITLIVVRPLSIPLWPCIVVVVLDLFILGYTAAREAPLHARLDRDGYSSAVIHDLVLGNWVRTLIWTANALILLGIAAHLVLTVS